MTENFPFQWTLVPCTLVQRNLHLSQTCCNTAELYILIICGARQNEVKLCCPNCLTKACCCVQLCRLTAATVTNSPVFIVAHSKMCSLATGLAAGAVFCCSTLSEAARPSQPSRGSYRPSQVILPQEAWFCKMRTAPKYHRSSPRAPLSCTATLGGNWEKTASKAWPCVAWQAASFSFRYWLSFRCTTMSLSCNMALLHITASRSSGLPSSKAYSTMSHLQACLAGNDSVSSVCCTSTWWSPHLHPLRQLRPDRWSLAEVTGSSHDHTAESLVHHCLPPAWVRHSISVMPAYFCNIATKRSVPAIASTAAKTTQSTLNLRLYSGYNLLLTLSSWRFAQPHLKPHRCDVAHDAFQAMQNSS